MLLIPAIDILDQNVVRLSQGNFEKVTVYSNDPCEVGKVFASVGVKHLHLVDLSGAKCSKSQAFEMFKKIKSATGCSIEAGGGIRSLADAQNFFSYFDIYEDKLMIGSLPFTDPQEFLKISERYANSILLTVDVWGEEIRIKGWQEKTSKNLFEFLEEMKSLGIQNFLITQIQFDGMLAGPDISLYKKVLSNVSSINLTASGGVSCINDFKNLQNLKQIKGAILGKAFYEKKISLQEIKEYNNFLSYNYI